MKEEKEKLLLEKERKRREKEEEQQKFTEERKLRNDERQRANEIKKRAKNTNKDNEKQEDFWETETKFIQEDSTNMIDSKEGNKPLVGTCGTCRRNKALCKCQNKNSQVS